MLITERTVFRANANTTVEWTLEQLYFVRDQYAAGQGLNPIGAKLARSGEAVHRVLGIMGIPIRSKGRVPTLSLKQKQQIARLLKKHTQQQVADKLGIGRFLVQGIYAAEKRRAQKQIH